jgi:hypothetical protein
MERDDDTAMSKVTGAFMSSKAGTIVDEHSLT